MWSRRSKIDEDALLARAIEFTGNATLYGSFMQRVIYEWPISAEHNLTDLMINRKAWVGHAAACLAIQCPEHVTREAWGHLSAQQRIDANKQADLAILRWETEYAAQPKGQLCLKLC